MKRNKIPIASAPCSEHTRNENYIAWHEEAKQKTDAGMKQLQCPRCGYWFFYDEFGKFKSISEIAAAGFRTVSMPVTRDLYEVVFEENGEFTLGTCWFGKPWHTDRKIAGWKKFNTYTEKNLPTLSQKAPPLHTQKNKIKQWKKK